MKTAESTLTERTGRMYRQLLVLQRLFQPTQHIEDVEWLGTGEGRDLALSAAIREILDELTEHARILTAIPFPISEWQPGDGSDDERWRALSEVERREVLSMVSGYESLISWSEELTRGSLDLVARGEGVAGSGGQPVRQGAAQKLRDAIEYLKDQRVRIGRFRQEMGFLERRRIAG